jgi:uncharacterized protein YueI
MSIDETKILKKEYFIEILRNLNNDYIFWELIDIFTKNNELYFSMKEITNKLNFTKNQAVAWDQIRNIIENDDISKMVEDFYMKTGVNREKHHIKLAKNLKDNNFSSDQKDIIIQTLKKLLKKLPTYDVIKKFIDSCKTDSRLSEELSNKNNINEFNEKLTIKGTEFYNDVCDYIQCQKQNEINEKILRKRDKGKEVPLLCITQEVYASLKDFLHSNNTHSPSKTILVNFNSSIFSLIISYDKTANMAYLENAKKGAKFNATKKLIKTVGGNLKFGIQNKLFCTIISLKAVDYVKA